MSDDVASKKKPRPRHPLVGNRVQAEIMLYVCAEAKPVSKSQLSGTLGSSRGKIST